jgi:hypothetical protein
VDFSYGLGKITLLGDPYVVANNGIRLNDNLQLARNLVTNVDGLIAFDEFHREGESSDELQVTSPARLFSPSPRRFRF